MFILKKDENFFILLLILTFIFSFFISLYHFGIEQGIFQESTVVSQALLGQKTRKRGSADGENMWSDTFEIEGSGVRTSKQKTSKIHPTCLPGGLWAGLGRQPCCQWLPGAVPERLWEGPGLPKKSLLAPLGPPGARRWSISPSRRLPGRVPEWLWEVILGAFFREGRPARKK